MTYTFPGKTCEKVQKEGIAQPVSFSINMVSVLVLVIGSFVASRMPVRIVLLSYALFELWHAWSHAVHIEGTVQYNVVHVLGIIMAVSTLTAIVLLSGKRLEGWQIGVIAGVMLLDILLFLKLQNTLVSVGTGLGVLVVIMLVCYGMLPEYFQRGLWFLIVGVVGILGLFMVEARWCEQIEGVPFHALIEVLGLVLFSYLAYLFIVWD